MHVHSPISVGLVHGSGGKSSLPTLSAGGAAQYSFCMRDMHALPPREAGFMTARRRCCNQISERVGRCNDRP